MSQLPPIPAVPVLSYAGPTVLERPAFNARRGWAWKGEHLFRVYLTPDKAWFIRIGSARQGAAAVGYQGGLLGMLIAWYLSKRAKKKAAKKALDNENRSLEELLPEHKRNHVIALADISDPAIEQAGFWGGSLTRWTFNCAGEKKRVNCALNETVDVDAAIQCLTAVLPTLRVAVEYNEKKKRYVKIKVK